MDQNARKPGKRDAESPPSENLATGEPCAWKSRKHGSGRGGWKRTRSRLAVTADASGRVNELRRKPSTSPAAYSTRVTVCVNCRWVSVPDEADVRRCRNPRFAPPPEMDYVLGVQLPMELPRCDNINTGACLGYEEGQKEGLRGQ